MGFEIAGDKAAAMGKQDQGQGPFTRPLRNIEPRRNHARRLLRIDPKGTDFGNRVWRPGVRNLRTIVTAHFLCKLRKLRIGSNWTLHGVSCDCIQNVIKL
jgi:hypothetical protein